jgi:hypothetical protein
MAQAWLICSVRCFKFKIHYGCQRPVKLVSKTHPLFRIEVTAMPHEPPPIGRATYYHVSLTYSCIDDNHLTDLATLLFGTDPWH